MLENGDIMKVKLFLIKKALYTFITRRQKTVGFIGMKYQSAESTGTGWQPCLHVAKNSCVKYSFLGTI